jgi:hypothetical protein
VVDPSHRFGFVWLNSSGGPDRFTIAGGPGRPADVPRGFPAAVVMIHSFSAADPADPRTIAGRWLTQGAFAYYGSVHEPFLPAFRTPRLVAELADAGIPLVAALRQGETEPMGRPWRLIYLGDPLYGLPAPGSGPPDPRLGPDRWTRIASESADWPVVAPGSSPLPVPAPAGAGSSAGPDDDLLTWCRDAAIIELTAMSPGDLRRPRAPRLSVPGAAESEGRGWLSVLKRIHRDRLDPRLRPILDDLLIDALSESGAFDEMQSLLARIPPDQRGLRVWLALEAGAAARLAWLAQDPETGRAFARALDLWDSVIRLSWPAGWRFPAQFTERVAAMAQADARRRLAPWHDRLRRALDDLAAQPRSSPHTAALAAERTRVETQLGRGR